VKAPSPDDTIVAISTPPGPGGLGVVRLSGDRALEIAGTFFRPVRTGSGFPERRAVLGVLVEPGKNEPFDEAVVTAFRAPRSFTREDVVEISCHGSQVVLEEVVRLAVRLGARLAHPGEFTRRAFLRGRFDILQAEAVNDLVRASSLDEARLAFRAVEGRLSKRILALRAGAVRLISDLEAAVEFPEEGISQSPSRLQSSMAKLEAEVERLIGSYQTGRALAQGTTLAIVGRKNVGKSTLFNALLGEPRAIVASRPGTTRDYLREKLRLGEAVFNLIDMAGLGSAGSAVEREGMKRGRRLASQADGILLVVDGSKAAGKEDLALIEEYRNKHILFIINKIDKYKGKRKSLVENRPSGGKTVEVSALRGLHIDTLRSLIRETFAPKVSPGEVVIFHLRDKLLLEEALSHLRRASRKLEEGHGEEVVAEEIRSLVSAVGRLTGEIRTDEVLDEIFGRFCVGK
jgi:tRNA modification GTPase